MYDDDRVRARDHARPTGHETSFGQPREPLRMPSLFEAVYLGCAIGFCLPAEDR